MTFWHLKVGTLLAENVAGSWLVLCVCWGDGHPWTFKFIAESAFWIREESFNESLWRKPWCSLPPAFSILYKNYDFLLGFFFAGCSICIQKHARGSLEAPRDVLDDILTSESWDISGRNVVEIMLKCVLDGFLHAWDIILIYFQEKEEL